MQIKVGDDLSLVGLAHLINGAPPPPGEWMVAAELRKPGGELTLMQPSAVWTNPATGAVRVAMSHLDTATLPPGDYQLAVVFMRVSDGYRKTTSSAAIRFIAR